MAIYAITAGVVLFAVWAVAFCMLCGSMARRVASTYKPPANRERPLTY
jgi:hypothetical protein